MTEDEQKDLYQKLGSRIKDLREKANLKQGAFAELLNLTRASIVNIEKGRQRPPIHLLWDVSRILKVDVIEILPNQSKPDDISKDWKAAINNTAKGDNETKDKLTQFIEDISSNEA